MESWDHFQEHSKSRDPTTLWVESDDVKKMFGSVLRKPFFCLENHNINWNQNLNYYRIKTSLSLLIKQYPALGSFAFIEVFKKI